MQNTVRFILILFLVALILLNYNSIRILNLALGVLNGDQEQRTGLVAKEFSGQLSSAIKSLNADSNRFQEFLRSRMEAYSILGVALYDSSYQPQLKVLVNLPASVNDLVENPVEILGKGLSQRKGGFLVVPGKYSEQNRQMFFILIFDMEKVAKIERDTRIMSYLNFLLIGFAALLAFYFIESTLRPYRVLLQTAKTAEPEMLVSDNRNEADFLIATFKGVIAKLKEKEQELEKLHRAEKARADDVQHLNQDLIRSISSGLIIIDQSKKIRVFNQAAGSILHLSPTQAHNQPYESIMEKVSTAFREDIDRCFVERTNINRAELEIRTQNGELRYLGANIMPLQDRQQTFAGVFCLFTDITEFKLLQEHIALKEKFASLGEMAAGMAHEFRNSVATITGYLQLLENKVQSSQRSYTAPISKELELLQKVVNDFLSFARPVELRLSKVHLGELVHECVEEVKVAVSTDSVEFTVKGNFPEVSADETMLRQVFANLLRNAAESVQGTGRKGKVEVCGSISLNGKLSVTEVHDNGSGIRPEDLPRIFTPFFSKKEKGVGLGLAIVQKLVLQHNGTITVGSSPDGSVFRVQLPLSFPTIIDKDAQNSL